MTLQQIANGINSHLVRFEADPTINTLLGGCKRYFHAYAYASGRYVGVCYVSYQGTTWLSKADATAYLAALEDGHVGTHRQVQKRHG